MDEKEKLILILQIAFMIWSVYVFINGIICGCWLGIVIGGVFSFLNGRSLYYQAMSYFGR